MDPTLFNCIGAAAGIGIAALFVWLGSPAKHEGDEEAAVNTQRQQP